MAVVGTKEVVVGDEGKEMRRKESSLAEDMRVRR